LVKAQHPSGNIGIRTRQETMTTHFNLVKITLKTPMNLIKDRKGIHQHKGWMVLKDKINSVRITMEKGKLVLLSIEYFRLAAQINMLRRIRVTTKQQG
jgi:hypothetical protein